ncbi:outer membrane protein transport protein [Chitinophaga horti]|uniref:Outer membrane protein transport protein n=1 Tax=Chitinophaga horti TaxID=2920382 RepID=A0ABY6IUS5_9BACT|nr:outer membrane protein transport protein [Chitinophaga horti]UYQ91116.1 outer membrane protein transport protein [Chitinophaga horti]
MNTTDLTDGYPVEYEYNLRTPWKGMVSASYIIGANSSDVKQQHGFITADAEYVNYAAMKYKFNKGSQSDRDYANALNNSIDQMYKGALNVRVGGELKFNVFAARAGFAYYSSPYEDSNMDGSNMKLSGGVGYRNRGFFIDLTYVHTIAKDTYYPFRLQDDGGVPVTAAQGNLTGGNILASVGFKF